MPNWEGSILEHIEWSQLSKRTTHEQANRERYTPVISTYRWWARRSHGVMGAILDAAMNNAERDSVVVSDPFSGGGTVAIEAARRELPVYAQDLYPWPIMGLLTSLSPVDCEEFESAGAQLIAHLAPLKHNFQLNNNGEIAAVLRVRVGKCPSCEEQVYLFTDPLVSKASRSQKEQHGYFGCTQCGHVTLAHLDETKYVCSHCSSSLKSLKGARGMFVCPRCQQESPRRLFQTVPAVWQPILVQEVVIPNGGRSRGILRPLGEGETIETSQATAVFPELRQEIPDGIETKRLLDSGLKVWGDLYTARQAEVILNGLRYLRTLDVSPNCKNRLAFAIIGLGEMPGYLSRWDRYHLKAFEGLANHRFADTNLVTEINPLSSLGRGTLIRRIASGLKALNWIGSQVSCSYPIRFMDGQALTRPAIGASLMIGNSACQRIPNGVVNLVLTDPPYFDDVQYGELARLFHFWLSFYQTLPTFDENEEAAPNRVKETNHKNYERIISECLGESCRTLAPGGRIIITFHNRKLTAWRSLCDALIRTNLEIQALAVVRAENGADHSKRDGRGQLYDLVIEFTRLGEGNGQVRVIPNDDRDESKALLAMGVALHRSLIGNSVVNLQEFYQTQLKEMGIQGNWIR